ncbi:Transmembrane domain-containing protein [Spironucleus salmonicida]|uniref:Transmembrane domain-containing protein n=1 Tax=Spironucleus salmonicida TaxID=348837 RepID=A0A9P8LNK8_9EUKA|nr:Transmembrane domain-containing protein [Spironucleus salmonicida]
MLSVLRTKKYKMNSCNFSISLQALVWNQQYTILLNYHALLVNIGVSQKYISSSAMHDPTHLYRQWIQQVPSSADVASLQQNSSQRVVVTIQNSSIPRLRSQAAYRVRLQSIIFDRLCIIRVLKIQYNQSSAQPVLALLVRIAFLVYFVPGLISEYVLVSIVAYYISTIVIYQISLQAPLPMHIYYQTPIKILLYILQYCIVVKHYPSTTHAYRGAVYGNTWGTSTSGTQFSSRQVLNIEYTNSLRHSLCLYSTGKNSLLRLLCTWAHK